MDKYSRCEVCKEAYFLSDSARFRHLQICLAVSSFSSSVRSTSSEQPASSRQHTSSKRSAPSDVAQSERKRRKTATISTQTGVGDVEMSSTPRNSTQTSRDNGEMTSSTPVASTSTTTTTTTTLHTSRDKGAMSSGPITSGDAAHSSKSRGSVIAVSPAVPPPPPFSAAATAAAAASSPQPSTSTTSSSSSTSSSTSSAPTAVDPSSSSGRAQQPSPPLSQASNQPAPLVAVLRKGLKSARDYTINNPGDYDDFVHFLVDALAVVKDTLDRELDICRSVKFNLVLLSKYNHPEGISDEFNFKTTNETLFSVNDLDSLLSKLKDKLVQEESEFQLKNSGWSLETPLSLSLRVSALKYKNTYGCGFLKLPKKIYLRKATVSVCNSDDKCFMYSMLVKHLPGEINTTTILKETHFEGLENTYNFTGLEFPVKLESITKFEKLNPNVSVNVFDCGQDSVISPLRVVDEKDDHTDLLLYRDRFENSHYVYITDFCKLIKPQVAKGRNRIVVCKRCSTCREVRVCKPNAKAWLDEHTELCKRYKPVFMNLPKEGENILKFVEYETQIPVPIIVIADFEATLMPSVATDRSYQTHKVNSCCALVKSTLPEKTLNDAGIRLTPYLVRSHEAGRQFLLYLEDLATRVERLYTLNNPCGTLTREEHDRHEQTTQCDLCKTTFNKNIPDQNKALDHCHITGNYRHTLCARCNFRAQNPDFIPVYLHNSQNYDNFFIMQSLDALPNAKVTVIPSTTEKYISISIHVGRMQLRILDSYRLLSDSLANLVGTLRDCDFVESTKLVEPEHVELIKRKSFYPYDHVTSDAVFEEKCLPPRESFYNRLNDEEISVADYEFAQSVWSRLGCKIFADYHEFYLKLDVCLLADVLTVFRNTCLDTYKIDCCHHYTAPGLAYRAMLRHTSVSLELITCPEQLMMVESGIRGGLVQCSERYAKANNKYLCEPSDYLPDDPTVYLMLVDANNLYGLSLSKPLPTGNFKWVDPNNADWSTLPEDAPTGYIMECDVEYPDGVHDRLQDLPPLPHQSIPPGNKVKKLLATLERKEKYIAHYTVFQQAVKLGLVVTKVHRVLSFSQSAFMKKFIDLNASLRALSTNEFYRNVYKLINNSTYGRLLLQKRNHRDVRIVRDDDTFCKLVRDPRFDERVIISENLIVVHLQKRTLKLDSPIQAGMVVLDHSKVHMYDFLYNVLQQHLPQPDYKMKLLYTDTDSLFLKIETEKDLFEVLKSPTLSAHLDRSSYPADHPLKDDTNRMKIGCFKDEAKSGKQIYEFVGLRSKMYAYRYGSSMDDAKLKAKGLKRSFVTKNLSFDDYKDVLFSSAQLEPARFNQIRNRNFELVSREVVKSSLSSGDDKRSILDCRIKSLPYGHYALRNTEEEEDNDTSSVSQ